MQSTFAPIELGKKGVVAHTLGMQTIGHNMSNASVEGYSRQRVEMNATEPLYFPQLNRENAPGQIGQGVEAGRIERVRDMLLEGRIVSERNVEGYWDSRDKYLLMLEQIYNEPTDHSVRTLMDRFWESWQDLSLHPTEIASRRAVLQRGKALLDGIHDRFLRLKGVRDMLEEDVSGNVTTVNELARDIAGLNGEIVKAQALGDNPNDLLDRRDLLVGKLSSLVNISVTYGGPAGEMVIATGGMHLVQGRHYERIAREQDRTNEGYSSLVWEETREPAIFRGGTLASLVELRDGDAREEIQGLDLLTVNFIDLVNEIHSRGFGLNGETGNDFFVDRPFITNTAGNYDANGDGAFDSTWVFRITGANALNPKDQVGLAGALRLPGPRGEVTVDYRPTDTVEDLITRINLSGSEVTARLNSEGKLSLKAPPSADPENPDFVIRGIEDSGQFLVGYSGILKESGPAGAYAWNKADAVQALRQDGPRYAVAPMAHPAGWIEVNPRLMEDPGSIAAAGGVAGMSEGIGDGTAALAMAQLRTTPVMIGLTPTFDGYFADKVADIGLRGEEAGRSLETARLVMKELTDMRESLSGVNIDEELTKMIAYQHGYAAIARFITTFDEMLNIIINRMGV